MMFENSTTFKPSDYGLFPGDQIDILCVGGGGAGWNTGGDRYNASGGGGGGAAGWWPGLFISIDAATDGTRNGGAGGSAEGGGGGTLTAAGKTGSATAGATTDSNGGLTANRPSLGGGDDPRCKNGKGVVVLCWD